MKLIIAVGHTDFSKDKYYGFGQTEYEAVADLRQQYTNIGHKGSFWCETYSHECTKRNYIPIPDSWKSKWGLCWIYWFFHWLAVQYYALTKFHRLYLFHDLDKPMKLTIGIPYIEVNRCHKKKAHHCRHRDPETVDWKQVMCDWEASAFSKPHGLLDALGTWYKYFRDQREWVIPILAKYHFMDNPGWGIQLGR